MIRTEKNIYIRQNCVTVKTVFDPAYDYKNQLNLVVKSPVRC